MGYQFPSFANTDIDCQGAPHLDYKGSAGFKGGAHIYIYIDVYIYIYIYVYLNPKP